MNYVKLWKQAENHLILNDSVKLMEKLKQFNHIRFIRVKIKPLHKLIDLYGIDNNNEIRIREDGMCFTSEMSKLCGEEFEIARDLNSKILFWIPDGMYRRTITRGMVDIMESQEFEINKNWPIIQIAANSIIQEMWNKLYNTCNKLDRRTLDQLAQMDYRLNRKRVKVKSLDQLMTEGIVYSNGNINLEKEDITFVSQMQSLCGKEFIATYRDDSYVVGQLSNGTGCFWTISRGMVTEI